jgi:hypothetical protein
MKSNCQVIVMSDVTYFIAILMRAHSKVLSFLSITIVSVKT